jgi:hypothetical protein
MLRSWSPTAFCGTKRESPLSLDRTMADTCELRRENELTMSVNAVDTDFAVS